MKRLLVTAALALALGLGYASAQNVTRSLQGSQDPRGPVGWDTSNAMLFPGHINSFGQQPATTVTTASCGAAATLGTGSTDVAGFVGMGASGTSCSVIFGSPFNAAPNCVITPSSNLNSGNSFFITTSTISFQVKGLQTAQSFFYVCIGNQ